MELQMECGENLDTIDLQAFSDQSGLKLTRHSIESHHFDSRAKEIGGDVLTLVGILSPGIFGVIYAWLARPVTGEEEEVKLKLSVEDKENGISKNMTLCMKKSSHSSGGLDREVVDKLTKFASEVGIDVADFQSELGGPPVD